MNRCAACRREAPDEILEFTLSVLDVKLHKLCPSCIDNRAEPQVSIIRTVNEVGWAGLPAIVRQAVRVYDMEEYVTVPTWAKRLNERQLVPREDPVAAAERAEDEAVLQRMREIRERMDMHKQPPKKKPSLVAYFLSLLIPWRTA